MKKREFDRINKALAKLKLNELTGEEKEDL
jgi:uncharacterized protein YnzC (UPF0291/DUF896 family)